MTVGPASRLDRRHWGVFLLLLALTWLAYGGNAGHQLLNFDDIPYTIANPWVTHPSWAGVRELFTGSELGNWHPLTWLSYIPDYRLCGADAACYKFTNISLHAANAFLVAWLSALLLSLSFRDTGVDADRIRLAGVVAGALFAVHPQHAESVIWVAERKDVLCAAFFLLAMICYLRQYLADPPRSSSLPFLFFGLALMSKSMALTLPAVLVLLDFHPLGRFRDATFRTFLRIAVMEKWHFHLAALLLVLVTFLTQDVGNFAQPTYLQRAAISAFATWHYLFHFFWPFGLSPYYPQEMLLGLSTPLALAVVAATATAIAAIAISGSQRMRAFFAYFLLTLVPVIGLVKVGEQAYADRYTYLPMVGFFVAAGYLVAALPFGGARRRIIAAGIAAAIVVVLGAATHAYKDTWRSNLVLWQYVVARYPDISPLVYNNLGNSYFEKAQFAQAIEAYRRGIALDPRQSDIYWNLGLAHERLGEPGLALQVYERGVQANGDVWSYVNAGAANDRLRRVEAAVGYYHAALALDPGNSYALLGLGKIFLQRGEVQRSIAALEQVSSLSPSHLDAQLLLAQAHMRVDRRRAAAILDGIERRYGASKELATLRARIDK